MSIAQVPGAPKQADGPTTHVEPSPAMVADNYRSAPGDNRIQNVRCPAQLVELMMQGKMRYDTEKARSDKHEREHPNLFKKKQKEEAKNDKDKDKAKSAETRRAEEEKAAAVSKAQQSLEEADLENEINKSMDKKDAELKGRLVPVTTDAGKSQGRPFTKWMYLDDEKKKLKIDSKPIADPQHKKLCVFPYSSTNILVAQSLENPKLKNEAMTFLALMFIAPTYVCTPGLYAMLHHQDNLPEKVTGPECNISSCPAVVSVAQLYRYYRALITAMGGMMKDRDQGRGNYEKFFVKGYKSVKMIGDNRSLRLRKDMQELAAKYGFTDITRGAQSERSLVEWCTKTPPGAAVALAMDDLFFRTTVHYINAMELFICSLLVLNKDLSSELCTPMVRPKLAAVLSTAEKTALRDHAYKCLVKMTTFWRQTDAKSSEMRDEGQWLAEEILEKQKEEALLGEKAPPGIDEVSPKAFYFLRLCSWLRMIKLENEVVMKE